jgi:hypothetical protein
MVPIPVLFFLNVLHDAKKGFLDGNKKSAALEPKICCTVSQIKGL